MANGAAFLWALSPVARLHRRTRSRVLATRLSCHFPVGRKPSHRSKKPRSVALLAPSIQSRDFSACFAVPAVYVRPSWGLWISAPMGARVSSLMGRETGLGDLPENCVAAVLVHLNPILDFLDRMMISKNESMNFRVDIGTSDFGYPILDLMRCMLICFMLLDCRDAYGTTLFDLWYQISPKSFFFSGLQEFWLEKSCGGLCMSIPSRALLITGIDDHRYWNYIPTEESRYHTYHLILNINDFCLSFSLK
ncbi:hypothetical protein B296_00000928 [Ensete ventricosum]|uniref:Uncharacterized protein n=1 Tax=Ensete ventricosum TaxID=4639 RepID=A0A427BAS2_ENSVE|nr:hypothetical protein B296_00000928 [Ensete ventricosum]